MNFRISLLAYKDSWSKSNLSVTVHVTSASETVRGVSRSCSGGWLVPAAVCAEKRRRAAAEDRSG